MTLRTPDDVLSFWLKELSPKDWYVQDDAVDAAITARFFDTWAQAHTLTHWQATPRGCLAALILMDQMSRNMMRGQGRAFSTDPLARRIVQRAVRLGFDLRTDLPERQFFYLPLEHSESLQDQERAVRLILLRMDAPETLLHAKAHRQIIRQFGRFPFRNAALGRANTDREQVFLEAGGYGAVLRSLQEA